MDNVMSSNIRSSENTSSFLASGLTSATACDVSGYPEIGQQQDTPAQTAHIIRYNIHDILSSLTLLRT